ncbi:hypothetical protein [Neptunicella sp. SCSIO 80796]|uniref:hypothetical protein n=1 Tax=Neptunicella plasticusilytica TaxID=3117012 RepID=UPI003A4E1C8A
MSDLEQQFELWLEGKLNAAERQEFEQQCQTDPVMAERLATAKIARQQVQAYQTREVPRWDAAATFATSSEPRGWFQWQGSLSFGLSILAICMVLFKVEIQVTDGAMTLSFAGKQQQQQVEKLVNDKLDQFQQNQQLALADFSQTMQDQQKLNNAQLTNYLLTSNREERREDFVELIKFVNEQRSDDQLFFAKQINKLQDDIYANPVKRP